MGDAGEGLVDAEDRIQQRLAEREAEKERQKHPGGPRDAVRERQARSLTLARSELARQAETAQNPGRQEQLRQAIAEIDRRIAEL